MKSVRWRINANGVEWFWAGKWHSTAHPQVAANLIAAINDVTASYPESRDVEFENNLARLLA
jgi:hypothetical protein